MNSTMNKTSRAASLPLTLFAVIGLTVLLFYSQQWMFRAGMTRVPVDPKNIPDSFPVVCMVWDLHDKDRRVPVVYPRHEVDDVMRYSENYDDYLYNHSYLLPLGRMDELRKDVKQHADGWLDARAIAGGKQLIAVSSGKSGHGLLKDVGWYIADERGYKPLYFARFLYPAVILRSLLASAVLCFAVRWVSGLRRRRYSTESA